MSAEATAGDLPALCEGFRHALFGRLLPIWQEHGWDVARGGFFDRLDRRFAPVPMPAKRLLVQCRQLFVFSIAARMAPELDCAGLAQRCFAFLMDRYWDRSHGGWFFSLSPEGVPHDRRKDTYGHAFALFALAHYHRVFGETAALDRAAETLARLEAHSAAANGGFHDAADESWRILPGARRQNPHMHLLEAFLALYEASGDSRYRVAAERMIRFLETVFFDPASGTLGEYFSPDWRPEGARGDIVEPGHHFEWSWLLGHAAALLRTPRHVLAERLFAWAVRYGIDAAAGGVFDELQRDGRVKTETKRLWPLAEAIRAHAMRCREGADEKAEARLARLLRHLLRCYLAPERGFIEHTDRAGRPLVDELYGSSPYHLLGAYLELSRQ
ncbi:MAG TPA: AGE family epimerase/isomerase [Stellaceae bacterium]|nr:AGE family epimerase/isomerase [Stellaceae bacterium]